jgi:predicted metal-dependent peptidase
MTSMTHAQKTKISQARTHVILRDPFFASILMDMDPVIDGDLTETCATDGDRVIFAPDWIAEADVKDAAAAMRKMALHVALAHHLRRGPTRDPKKWRAACDQSALHIMKNDDVTLPIGCEPNPMFADMTTEEIYRNLIEQEDQEGDQPQSGAGDMPDSPQGGDQGGDQGDGAGQPSDKPGGDGGVGQALDGADMRDPTDVSQKKADNDQRIARAAMAEKAAGDQSGLAKELIGQIKSRGIDWRDRLIQFVDSAAETRLSWSRPNRRFVGQDIYLPGKTSDGIDTLAFIVDTSGSMSKDELGICVDQIEAARDAIGIKEVVVIQIDTKVKAIDTFDRDDPLPTDMEFVGRGGTNMAPAFEAAMTFDPSAIIMMTDGVFGDLTDDPGVATLFALTHKGRQGRAPATFGTFVDMPAPADA